MKGIVGSADRPIRGFLFLRKQKAGREAAASPGWHGVSQSRLDTALRFERYISSIVQEGPMFGCGTGRHFSFVFLRRFASLTFLFGLILLGGAAIARAQTETVLHSFVGFPTDVYGSSA
ncbi:MAG: hypothetical protein M1423_02270, partial [Acidobacteria bacterium]|nr:hypothetical protein [Acidobacteriota bacterium]